MTDARPEEFIPVDLALRDGRKVLLRQVRAEDREKLQAAIRQLSPESRYARFMMALRELPPDLLERGVAPDPSRELQLLAVTTATPHTIVAGARYSAVPGSDSCEFAVAVVDEWQGTGLGRRLLEALMAAARNRGLRTMEGYILTSNARMLELVRRLGFTRAASTDDPRVCLVRRDLTGTL